METTSDIQTSEQAWARLAADQDFAEWRAQGGPTDVGGMVAYLRDLFEANPAFAETMPDDAELLRLAYLMLGALPAV